MVVTWRPPSLPPSLSLFLCCFHLPLQAGVMHTHDEDTRKFFRNTGVHCLMAPRTPAENSSFFRKGVRAPTCCRTAARLSSHSRRATCPFQIVSTFYTHHQKVVIADAQPPPAPPAGGEGDGQGRRRLVGYLGGIDLCGGRYDTQEHSLFRTGLTVHKDDWQQHNMNVMMTWHAGMLTWQNVHFNVSPPNPPPHPQASRESGCPRQPWHDLHSKVEGPSVWDLVTNFEQRWRAACGGKHQSLKLELQGLRRDAGIEQEGEEEGGEAGGAGEDKWHTQVGRGGWGGGWDGERVGGWVTWAGWGFAAVADLPFHRQRIRERIPAQPKQRGTHSPPPPTCTYLSLGPDPQRCRMGDGGGTVGGRPLLLTWRWW